eukprot:TRINITY_DN4271_c0_g1_i2.p1 TRINITY_DN4271_c0_g1~~TRINITY_DN4271_c0_g1_i2.p1  ORF type:complete len:633 (-),score=130.07 TRINITY_DN4271_c0_g1_i2:555-2429(-)
MRRSRLVVVSLPRLLMRGRPKSAFWINSKVQFPKKWNCRICNNRYFSSTSHDEDSPESDKFNIDLMNLKTQRKIKEKSEEYEELLKQEFGEDAENVREYLQNFPGFLKSDMDTEVEDTFKESDERLEQNEYVWRERLRLHQREKDKTSNLMMALNAKHRAEFKENEFCDEFSVGAGELCNIDPAEKRKIFTHGLAGKPAENVFDSTGYYTFLYRLPAMKIIAELEKRAKSGFVDNTANKAFALTGLTGSGRSFMLNSIVYWAGRNDWLTITVPFFKRALGVHDNTEYLVKNAQGNLWDTPEATREFLEGMTHQEKLHQIKMKGTYVDGIDYRVFQVVADGNKGSRGISDLDRSEIEEEDEEEDQEEYNESHPKDEETRSSNISIDMEKLSEFLEQDGITLADLVAYGLENPRYTSEVLKLFFRELNLVTEFPVLVAVDDYNYIFGDSGFADPEGLTSSGLYHRPLPSKRILLGHLLSPESLQLNNGNKIFAFTGDRFSRVKLQKAETALRDQEEGVQVSYVQNFNLVENALFMEALNRIGYTRHPYSAGTRKYVQLLTQGNARELMALTWQWRNFGSRNDDPPHHIKVPGENDAEGYFGSDEFDGEFQLQDGEQEQDFEQEETY